MRWIVPILLTLFVAGCLESNPQPAPSQKDNQDPTGQDGTKDLFPETPDDSADATNYGGEKDALDGAPDMTDALGLDVLPDGLDLLDVEPLEDVGDGGPLDVPDTTEPVDLVTPEDVPQVEDTTADVVHGDSQLRGGGSFFGECWGACKQDLTIDDTAVNFVASNWDDSVFVDNDGTLTPAGLAKTKELAEALIGVELEATYGCPDCDDGGGFYVTLLRDGNESTHTYPFGQPFTSLTDCDTFIKEMMTALASCQSTQYITVGNDCGPLG